MNVRPSVPGEVVCSTRLVASYGGLYLFIYLFYSKQYMAGVANDHFAWRLQGFYSQPRLTRKRVRSQKEKEKKKEANMD